jgi:hypothetical protein
MAERIYSKEIFMTIEVDNLKTKITALETAVDSLIVLTKALAADFASAKEDPVEIQALADSVQGELDKVTAELAADTPPAPPVTS